MQHVNCAFSRSIQNDVLYEHCNKPRGAVYTQWVDDGGCMRFPPLHASPSLQVYVTHCTHGVTAVSGRSVDLDPGEAREFTFQIRTYKALGSDYSCEVQLFDADYNLISITCSYSTVSTSVLCHKQNSRASATEFVAVW